MITLNGTTGITTPNVDGEVGNNTPAEGNFTAVNVSGALTAGTLTTGGGTLSPQTGFKNRIINGAMTIDQRNAGASVTPTTTGTYTIDRWSGLLSVASKFSLQQNAGAVTPPIGFANYFGATSLSAYTVGASEFFAIRQIIEGFNVADLNWGTANAATVTLSFWSRSSLTGTFSGALRNGSNARSYPFIFTISVANTWEYKTVTVIGDTTGTWGITNDIGINLAFNLGAGATVSGTAGAWAAGNFISATGATSVVGTSGATFYITGVQLEKGSTATPFEFRSIGTELGLCQRYFQKGSQRHRVDPFPLGALGASVYFPVSMRATPTIVATAGLGTLVSSSASVESAFFDFSSGVSGNVTNTFTASAEL